MMDRSKTGDQVKVVKPRFVMEDLVLSKSQAGSIVTMVSEIQTARHTKSGLTEAAGVLPKGTAILFRGGSGSGKEMMAEVVADRLGLSVTLIDLAGVVSKYIGETEKNLNKVFESADAADTVLFFDEADSLFGKRTDVKDSHDRYANTTTDFLLQRMETYEGLSILATNLRSEIDPAFLRRFRYVLNLDPPVKTKRKLKVHRKKD